MIVAVVIAGLISLAAYGARLLTRSGAIAATFVGAATLHGGARWVVLLLFFFISSAALSRWRANERDQLLDSVVEKGSRRDASQVLANGGVFAIAAFLSTLLDQVTWQAVGAGAISAATADTWSTEIGTVLGRSPRGILSGREVAPGTSGGITIAGSISSIAAAILVAGVAWGSEWSVPALAIISGGLIGSVADSLLGATVQELRRCPACNAPTERRIHACGTATTHRAGIRGCDNDVVNLLSTFAGAVVTWILS